LKIYIVIPAHNEEENLGKTLKSLVNQQLKPTQLIVVNDNSTDQTTNIVNDFVKHHSWIQLVHKKSSEEHLPGAKVVAAFYEGYKVLDQAYDIICKFDADMVFEEDYLKRLSQHFENNPRLGMAAGQCFIQKNGQWVLESLSKDDHIRGSLKAYRKACFLEIGKIAESIGWDTLDEWMARYFKWDILVDPSLKVKHLKPTGFKYSAGAGMLQGVATYRMRMGITLTAIMGLKRAWKTKQPLTFFHYLKGYSKAKKDKSTFLIDAAQGEFLRKNRWKGIWQRFHPK